MVNWVEPSHIRGSKSERIICNFFSYLPFPGFEQINFRSTFFNSHCLSSSRAPPECFTPSKRAFYGASCWFNEIIKLSLQWNVIKMLSTTRDIMRKFFSCVDWKNSFVHFNWLIVLDIPLKPLKSFHVNDLELKWGLTCNSRIFRLQWRRNQKGFKYEIRLKLRN